MANTNKPPVDFKRNQYGLLEDKNIKYEFSEDGTVNWRKMIKTEFLVANRELSDETDVSKLEDITAIKSAAGGGVRRFNKEI